MQATRGMNVAEAAMMASRGMASFEAVQRISQAMDSNSGFSNALKLGRISLPPAPTPTAVRQVRDRADDTRPRTNGTIAAAGAAGDRATWLVVIHRGRL